MMVFLKIVKESLVLSLQQLWANRLRTILSLLGVTIGIFSIIAILTAVDSMKADIEQDLESLGDDLVMVHKWPFDFSGDYPYWKYYQRPHPSFKDFRYVQDKAQTVRGICFNVDIPQGVVSKGSRKLRGLRVFGTTFGYNKLIKLDIAYGRYFTQQESKSGYAVGIIGADAAEQLFNGKQDIVGQDIDVDGVRVKIVGVVKKEGQGMLGMNHDKTLIMPFKFVERKLGYVNNEDYSELFIAPKENISVDGMIAEIRSLMRNTHRLRPKEKDDFSLSKFSLITNTFKGMLGTLTIAGIVIGGLSLLVGGFGIANIMYVSVKERTRIIGVKMALGARSEYILLEFLFESVLLCVFGGIIGMLIVLALLKPASAASGFPFILTMKNVSFGIGVSVIIGMLAGILPAIQASRLDPVEAIRAN